MSPKKQPRATPALTDSDTLAGRLVAARKAAGLSQEALAREASVSTNAVRRIEQRLASDPAATTLVRIAAALGTTAEHLILGNAPTKRRR